jgi:hypothetical protein
VSNCLRYIMARTSYNLLWWWCWIAYFIYRVRFI